MYKTIVVHLASGESMTATMRVAARLAGQMEAHLIGTATTGIVELNYLLAAGAPMAVMAAGDIDNLQQEAQQQLHQFEAQCQAHGVPSFEARLMDTSAADALLLQSRYCDLLVTGKADLLDYGMLLPARLPDTLLTKAARPVLLVPPNMPADVRFDKIMVAWNGSQAASRAIAFAMPLIARAAKVYVAVCNAIQERIDVGSDPGVDLAVYLSRLHRNVELLRRDTDEDPDLALTSLAAEAGVQLIVAGAFGHSRIHDLVLGSTTRGLIARTEVPLLMAN